MKQFLTQFDRQFSRLHQRSCEIIEKIPTGKLFWQPLEKDSLFPINSCGEYILRSAGKVEQTFGGITTKLWDDPFEWTLPEKLHAFNALRKQIPRPATRLSDAAKLAAAKVIRLVPTEITGKAIGY